MEICSINPTKGETIRTYTPLNPNQVAAAIAKAHDQWRGWRTTTFAQRGEHLRNAARILRQRKEELGRLMALEMGKPLPQGIAEAEKCATACEHYAEHGEGYLAPDPIPTEALKSTVFFEPLGVILAIMPWNFPLWQVFRFAAPALMAGNAAVLKHASNVSGCALVIEETFEQAGFPPGLFRTLLIPSSEVRGVIEHPFVRAVTLTGSTPAGQAVASQAGAALKKTVLELGGSDPYIVLADADLDQAAQTCVNSRLINSGQSCIAAKRFIVVQQVLGSFTEKFVEAMKSKKTGDPLAAGTDIGPLARTDLREGLHRQVKDSIGRGARLLLGGEIPDGPGAFYPPTVLGEVAPGMAAYEEELFGPVAAIIPARDAYEAVRIANDTNFGLGAALFTSDLERAEHLATQIEAGQVFVNAFVASDPRLPFGGIKSSGYGRELGAYGMREFVNAKTVVIKKAGS